MAAPLSPPPPPTPEPVRVPSSHFPQTLFWLALAAALFCAAGWYRAARTVAHPQVPWPFNAVIQPNQQTRVVVSDSSLMLRLLGQNETTLDEYLQPDYRRSLIPPHLPDNVDRLMDYISDSQLTSFADLAAMSTLMKLAGPLNSQLVLTSARDLDRRDRSREILSSSAVQPPTRG